MDMPDVSEKIGPLPVWAWALVGGGVILVAAKLGHAGSSGGTTVTSLGGGTPIINGVDPQQAASDREKAVADAITKQQGSDQTIFDQAKAAWQSAADALKAQTDQALADLRAADAATLQQQQAADNSQLDQQKTGFLAQIQAAIAAGQAEAQRLKDFYTAEEAGIRSQDQSVLQKQAGAFQATIAGLNATIAQLRAGQGGTAAPPAGGNPNGYAAPVTKQGWLDQTGQLYGVIYQWATGRLEPGTVIQQGWALPVAYNGVHDLVRIQTGGGVENAAARVGRWVAEAMSGNPTGDVGATARAQIARLGADALDSAGAGNITQDQAGQILYPYGFDFGPVWDQIVALRRQRGTI